MDLEPTHRCWTREEYYRAYALGLFRPEERLELIEGEIIAKMSPMLTPHAVSVMRCENALRIAFAAGFCFRVQLPFVIDENSEPEPDIAVVVGEPDDYLESHPTVASLVVEVSDTTLRQDRGVKAALYARAGVEEYWIINLTQRLLEVHRQPASLPDEPRGWGYRSLQRLTEQETVSPLASPQAVIAISDLFPRPTAEA